ncbi:DUF4307 domain-containing protein [Cryobacterium tagatosivorans]|uniref:DUF4307 domain-containing protein n=1 Tax=Cryobacterium tagatosivorans TaxID=1259199 RepID=A0A4R8UFQ8_9MICO|nr:DUF4307 domain-containing protein [Cryobacterium tagatosivorans]
MSVSTNLDARYGRTPNRRLRDRRSLWIAAGGFALVLVAWVVWAGLDGSKPLIEARDTRHSIIDEHSVSVTFEVSMPAGTAASCAVEALNENFTIVGWKVVDLAPSDRYTRSFTEIIRTTELSNTGLIYRCWLT